MRNCVFECVFIPHEPSISTQQGGFGWSMDNHSSHYTPGGLENNKQLTGSFSCLLSILSQAEREKEREKGGMFTNNITLIKRKLAGIHRIMHLCWINVRDLQNESKLHHVFLLILDFDTSWLSQLQSRRANKSVWNLVLISQTCTKQMLRRERCRGSACE